MRISLIKELLKITFLVCGYLSSSSALAAQCALIEYLGKNPKQVNMSSLNQTCLDQLSPSGYDKFISVLLEAKIDNHILQSHSQNDHALIDELIVKTISFYKSSQNPDYSNALLKLLETQKLTTLQDYFDDDCTPLNNEKIQPVDKEAFLYFHSISNNKFLTILILKEKIVINTTYTDIVKNEVDGLRQALINPLFSTMNERGVPETQNNPLYVNIRRHAKSLYKLLIQPFSDQLAASKIEHLVIIPDSTTGIFPIETLIDEKDNKYVIDKDYSISYSPNLSNSKKSTNKTRNVLFISPESPGKSSSFNNDLKLIEKLVPAASRVRGNKATELGLFNAIANKPMSFLYVASHAQFEQNFEDSFIQLSDKDTLSVKKFERMTSSLSARILPPELMVLSACETAQGKSGNVDASLGLAGVAARSGVNTVIASLWVTRSPEVLLGRKDKQEGSFFQIISDPKFSKARALQESKKLLKSRRSIYEWAAFVLIGDWGKI